MIEMKIINMNYIYSMWMSQKKKSHYFQSTGGKRIFSSEIKLRINIRAQFIYPQSLNFRPAYRRLGPSSVPRSSSPLHRLGNSHCVAQGKGKATSLNGSQVLQRDCGRDVFAYENVPVLEFLQYLGSLFSW